MEKQKKKRKKHMIILLVIILFIIFIACGFISPLKTVKYDISSEKIPKSFDGFRIVQLTDFHCKEFGDKESKLITEVQNANPYIIVLTGDFADKNHSTENLKYLIEGITPIAPVYYVTGNHEHDGKAPLTELYDILIENDVTILDAKTVPIEISGEKILLSGVNYLFRFDDLINKLGAADTNCYNILLYHGSDDFQVINYLGYDLILSGHGHGGIVRLPFVGGVFGNNRDFFPEYDYGMFKKGSSTLISSSGLGDSILPRFNNPREIVCITLHTGE